MAISQSISNSKSNPKSKIVINHHKLIVIKEVNRIKVDSKVAGEIVLGQGLRSRKLHLGLVVPQVVILKYNMIGPSSSIEKSWYHLVQAITILLKIQVLEQSKWQVLQCLQFNNTANINLMTIHKNFLILMLWEMILTKFWLLPKIKKNYVDFLVLRALVQISQTIILGRPCLNKMHHIAENFQTIFPKKHKIQIS